MKLVDVLQKTRTLNLAAAFFLSFQFYGNLYEENIAISNVTSPKVGSLISPFAAGSPFYFYVPWVIIGLILTVVFFVRIRRFEALASRPSAVAVFGSLAVVTAAKVFLVTQVNDNFRDPALSVSQFVSFGWIWLAINGVAVIAGGFALWNLLSWRRKLLSNEIENNRFETQPESLA